MRDRVASVVDRDHHGFSNSSYVGIDPNAYDVWKSHGYWVVPWLQEQAEEETVAVDASVGGTRDSRVGGGGGDAGVFSNPVPLVKEKIT